jgi:TonB family protein
MSTILDFEDLTIVVRRALDPWVGPSGTDHAPAWTGSLLEADPVKSPTPRPVATGRRPPERTPDGRGTEVYFPDGTLNPQVVAGEIEQRRSALVSAYERSLRNNPSLAGRIDVRFTIARSGRVRRVVVTRDTMNDAELRERVRALLRSWRFPAPSHGELQISYPFTFRPAAPCFAVDRAEC